MSEYARTSFQWSLWAFLLLVGVLPGGTFYGIPLKHILLGSLLASSFILFYCNKTLFNLSNWYPMIVGALCVGGLYGWVLLGAYYNPAIGVDGFIQWKGLALTFFVPSLVLVVNRFNALSTKEFVAMFIVAGIVFSVIKISIITSIVNNVFSYEDFHFFFVGAFGYPPVTMQIASNVYRLFLINDLIVLFSIFLIVGLRDEEWGGFRGWRWLVFCVLIVSIFFSYSRVMWLACIGLMVLAFVDMNGWGERVSRIPHLLGGIMVSLLVVSFILSLAPDADNLIQGRFVDAAVSESDDLRGRQINNILSKFPEHPILGVGFGAQLDDLPGPDAAPFAYEVQWLSYVFQLGVLGVLVLLSAVFILPTLTGNCRWSKKWWVLTAAYVGWISMSFTNPYLGSSTTGLLFALFALLFQGLAEEKEAH